MRKRSDKARWHAGDYESEFRIEVGTLFFVVEGVRVAKKVGREWITLVPGWHVEEGWGGPDGGGPVTSVEYEG